MRKRPTPPKVSRYKADPLYRLQCQNAARARYRGQSDFHMRRPITDRTRRAAIGKIRNLTLNGNPVGRELSYTVGELCLVLGEFSRMAMCRWQNNGQFPFPVFGCPDERSDRLYYSEPQVDSIARLLAKHFRLRNQIRTTDTELINQLHESMTLQ